MDSLTQIVLGAAVGEAVVGKKEGRKGAAWGAVLGTLPDLDVLVYPFVDPVMQLAVHRSASHSFLVAMVAAPVLGWLLKKIHRRGQARTLDWIWMVLLTLTTHAGIDLFTVYGTQIWWPLSDYPCSFDTIFIIDPFYTLPLTLGVLVSLVAKRTSQLRMKANMAGILLSSLYLTWSCFAKLTVQGAFRQGLASNGFRTERLLTAPTPLNTALWMGIGMDNDSLRVGLYSVFDTGTPGQFISIGRNSQLLAGHMNDRAVQRLMWFSKGWYVLEEDSLGLLLSDYRFGRSDSWLEENGHPVFQFRLELDSTGTYSTFSNQMPGRSDPLKTLKLVYERAKGID